MYLDKIKNYLKKLNYKCYILAFLLLFGIMPIIPRAVSTYLTTYSYMVLVVAVVLFTVFACRLSHLREMVAMLLPFLIYQLLAMLFVQNKDVLLAGYQILLFMLPVCVGFYLYANKFRSELYSAVIVIAYFITAVTTIFGCMKYPDAARILATTKTSQDPTAVIYEMMNIGGYSFVYSMVLLYPFVVLAFKMKRLHIIPTVIITVVVFSAVISASYSYAFMLLMVTTLLFFIPRNITVKRFILLTIFFVLVVFLFRSTVAAIVSALGDFLGNSTMTNKINAIFLGKDAIEGFDDDRGTLYMLSIKAFLKNPLIGNLSVGRDTTGGHSFILDNLGNYGLVGGILMLFMYRGIWRTFFRPLKNRPGFCLVLWAFIQPLILSSINTGMWQNNLCLYTPILLCIIYGNEIYQVNPEKSPSPLVKVNVLQSKVRNE